jgi:hypothetical protein
MTDRRTFVRHAAGAAPLLLAPSWVTALARAHGSRPRELEADVVIIGGGLGGCAAALAAARHGLRVILTEETDWIGGQLTAQAVPPDENAWIETIGGTASYRALRSAVRDWYRTNTPLLARARGNPRLNPGNGWVSRLCAEPRVWQAVLHEALAPHGARGRLRVLLEQHPIAADVTGDRVRAITVRSARTGDETVLHARWVVDATELGDLLPLTGTEFVTGAEARVETGEPHTPDVAQPDNEQGFTWCFAVEHRAGEHHVIDRPEDYAYWRDLVPDAATGTRLLSFDDAGSARLGFDPVMRTGLWSYRRVIDRDLFAPGTHASDVTIVNWGQNDYAFGSLTQGAHADRAYHVARARALSRALLYWLQTAAPRRDGGEGWPGLRLRPDVMGTADGFAKAPYIRESRRIRARSTIREPQVTVEGRAAATRLPRAVLVAEPMADSVGIGHYALDLHRTTRGDAGVYAETLPFQLPLGALVPQRMTNLLPACKNIGTTHRTNGCFRLHPIEWNVGESVGVLLAYCQARRTTPHAVQASGALREDYRALLARDGVPLAWPSPLPTP